MTITAKDRRGDRIAERTRETGADCAVVFVDRHAEAEALETCIVLQVKQAIDRA